MQKFFWLLLLLVLGNFPIDALAHSKVSDRALSAFLHIDPEDSPIVGEKATLYLDFEDKNKQFRFPECDCKITILEGERVGIPEMLYGEDNYPYFSYIFPEKGVYQVQVEGKSKEAGKFADFRLVYDVRVERGTASEAPRGVHSVCGELWVLLLKQEPSIIASIVSGIIIFVVFVFLFVRRKYAV